MELSRRRLLKLGVLLPLALESSGVPRYRDLYRQYGSEVEHLCDPPSREEAERFIRTVHATTQADFRSSISEASTPELHVKYLQTIGTEGRTSEGFVFSRGPIDQAKKGLLYYHSLACPSFDLDYWSNGFGELLDNGYTIAMALGNQCDATIGARHAYSPGLITDNAHTDSLRLVSTALGDMPHLADIPWRITGISMGGSMGYSALQWWSVFGDHYRLPQQIEQISLYSPYASLMNPVLLQQVVSRDQSSEEPGLNLAMKWAIQDSGEIIRTQRGQPDTRYRLPIEHLIGLTDQEKALFRQRVMYSSPAYHTYARRALGIAPVSSDYRISFSTFDQVVPPDQTKALVSYMREERMALELVELPGFHAMVPDAKPLLHRVMGEEAFRGN